MRWSIVHFLTSHTFDLSSIVLHCVGLLLCLCLLGVAQWELAIRSVSIVRVVLGLDADYKSANPYARRRKWAALLLYSLAAVAPLLVMIFWIVLTVAFVINSRGIPFSAIVSFFFFAIVGLSFTCTVSWSLLASALAFTVLSCEDGDLNSVFPRTYRLMKNYMWRGGSFVVLLTFTLFAVTGALDLPLLVFSLFDAWRNNNLTSDFETPLYLEVLSTFIDGIVNILLLSVAPIAYGLYYNDLLLRMEGRDISLRLQKLENAGEGAPS
jgi:hypothetical protein